MARHFARGVRRLSRVVCGATGGVVCREERRRAMPRAVNLRLSFIVVAMVATSALGAAPMRGVIEGYYGRPWSGDARRDVIAFMGFHHLNTFVYAPKNDDYHRARWRETY